MEFKREKNGNNYEEDGCGSTTCILWSVLVIKNEMAP